MVNTCGAKTRKGTPCQKQAGWGTDHFGTGKCRLHGGASKGAPLGNQNATKHGLYSKYVPVETIEIAEMLKEIDMIQSFKMIIAIQEAAIIRAQNIMYVENKDELVKYLKKSSSGQTEMEEYEFQYAWDRQGAFLLALSRAMGTLTNMYRTLHELEGNQEADPKDIFKQFADALNVMSKEVWKDEEEAQCDDN